MPFRDVLGQPHAIETLRRGLARGKLHHALLFAGPEGTGKELAAFAVACAIVCKVEPGEGCGKCRDCHRATTFSNEEPHVPHHPDVVVVARGLYPREVLGRSTEEKTDISVDQVRRVVLEKLALQPHEAPQRVVIVRRADEMSPGAANALLKTLEEPPTHTRFVLMTARPGELLPTILSRTQLIRFAPLSDELVERVLIDKSVEPSRAKDLARLSGGSVEVALALADPEASDGRKRAVEILRNAARGPLPELLEATSSYPNTGEGRVELKDHLAALAAEEAAEVRRLVIEGGDPLALDRALARREAAVALSESMEKNANVPLALEAAWLQLHRQ
ncbi:MAG: DNA polymerase III subunit [Polyangiales bacterium]